MFYSNLYARLYTAWHDFLSSLFALWRFRSSRWYFLFTLLLQVGLWWEAFEIYHNLASNFIILHYNVDFGIDLVGDSRQIFLYPALALGVFLLNTFLASSLHQRKDFNFFIHFLLLASLVFSLFLNLALLFIYIINFR